ncbi:hypothetical protein S7711_11026 [Stachybotrys chartarum IBT 7711]|uniref:Uncharacterized protein n=1 Tax=Stachybotrys chartarum (strain CBS 109288 / IBT 7711) TaxID=1280523 RepID=A0A084B4Z0_STACB|nr:hypothetical protein S7711_11026 [Stachybotrys chartarum IBT 7711]
MLLLPRRPRRPLVDETRITPSTSTHHANDTDKLRCLQVAKLQQSCDAPSFKFEHNGHEDFINTNNLWSYTAYPTPGDNWNDLTQDFWDDWVLSYGDSLSSDQLYQREKVQDHLKTLASLSRQTLPLLKQIGSSSGRKDLIPLFAGENGCEYQLEPAWWSKLPFLRCPSNSEERPWNHDPMQLLTSRVSTDIASGAIPMPKLVVQLGRLWVRGNTRESKGDDPISERTDWEIMVDLENEDLPLWTLSAAKHLSTVGIMPTVLENRHLHSSMAS